MGSGMMGNDTMIDNGRQAVDNSLGAKKSEWKSAFLLSLISMVLLWLSQEPVGLSGFVWFALVPWLVMAVRSRSYVRSAIVSLICGSGYYIASLYWLANVTLPGMLALSVAMSLYFVMWGFILKIVYAASGLSFTLVLPVLWVGQEYLRATLLTGFPWLFLSHCLHDCEHLTQVADVTGAYGVTFVAAMVNGFIADILLRPQYMPGRGGLKGRNLLLRRLFILASILTAVNVYGIFRYNESSSTMTEGPVISVVQGAVPQHVKDSGGASIYEILDNHMAMTREAGADEIKPELVVWPETMVLTNINEEFLALADDVDMFVDSFKEEIRESVATNKALAALARDIDSSLLIGTPSQLLSLDAGKDELVNNGRTNSAIMYNADGSRGDKRYDKMHRVPFGEYLPFKESIPWLNKFLINLTPYKYDYSIKAGVKPVAFKVTGKDGKEYKFTVAICYEDVIPTVARKLANWNGADFMLNISNDGWFVNEDEGEIKPTSELMQHLIMSRYRAIENRIGIARAVNCGISGMIKPDGSIQTGSAGTLPADDVRGRSGKEGYLTDTIWLDSRSSIYSRVGDVFAILCTVLTGLIFLWTLRRGGAK